MKYLTDADIFLDEYQFLRICFKGGGEITLEDAIEHEKAIIEECEGIPHAFIVDGRITYSVFSHEARNYMAKSEEMKKLRLVEAILVDNLPNRLTANAFKNIDQPGCEIEIFTDEAAAVNWLKSKLVSLARNP